MTQTLIIEDEKPSARRLQRLLEKAGLQVVKTLHSVEESLKWFPTNQHPELIFLDIQLSDGLSFEIFDQLDIRSYIIFTTAYDQYALQAFKLNSIDYLMKPIDDEELERALQKYKRYKPQRPEILDMSDLKALLNPETPRYKERFTIQVGQHLKLISTRDISCFYSENKATYLRGMTRRTYSLDASLEHLESELDPAKFFRVNRKFIIHFDDIQDILTYSNQRLEVRLKSYTEQHIIVSRERVRNFREWLS